MINPFKSAADIVKMRNQAAAIQKKLAEQTLEINEDGVRIVITGDQKIQAFEIQGISNEVVKDILNRAIKQSQEMAAKQLTSMAGDLQGLLGGAS